MGSACVTLFSFVFILSVCWHSKPLLNSTREECYQISNFPLFLFKKAPGKIAILCLGNSHFERNGRSDTFYETSKLFVNATQKFVKELTVKELNVNFPYSFTVGETKLNYSGV